MTHPTLTRATGTMVALVAFGGCTVADGDLASTSAIVGISLEASTDRLDQRATQVTGQIDLGYTSSDLVDLVIRDNGVEVYSASFNADKNQKLPVDADLPLLFTEHNALTAQADYAGDSVSFSLGVDVPTALTGFSLDPAAAEVDVFEVGISGPVTAGYRSTHPATVDVLVDGLPAWSTTLDLSQGTTASIAADLPLLHPGDNEVVAEVHYDEASWTHAFTVTVTPPAPAVTLPSWATNYVESVEMVASGTLMATAAPGWTVDSVSYSIDGGATWRAAVGGGADDWAMTLIDPDIGTSDLLYSVQSSNRGIHHTTQWTDTLTVDPIFDCSDPGAMTPTNELVRDNRDEVRSMVGYFGDPDGGHIISFVLTANADGQGLIDSVGQTTSYGRFAMETSFNVDEFRCNNNPCQQNYALEVLVDGVSLCSDANFGQVMEL